MLITHVTERVVEHGTREQVLLLLRRSIGVGGMQWLARFQCHAVTRTEVEEELIV
jgi:hypothetical protein